MVLENPPIFEEKEYLLDVKLQTSQKLAFEFLETIGVKFNDLMLTDLGTLNLNFKNYIDLKDNELMSYSEYKDGSLDVNIVYYNDLSDCYTIIHELLHALNTVIEDDLSKKYRRDILTETISLLGTVEAEKYFLKTRLNDEFTINKMDDYYGIYENALKTKDTLNLLDTYLEKGQIDDNDLRYVDEDTVNEILTLEEIQIPFYERYILAYVLVNYIEANYNGKDILIRLMDMIKNNTLEEIFSYLNLDFNIIKVNNNIEFITDISDNSLERLRKALNSKTK
ncbi:MAG: hypothetical protein IKN87_04270 [Bacilli bacterium]|nr:hypothetical protein [Bacilli bacterium]